MEPWDRVGTQSMPEKQFSADDFDRLHVLLVEDNEHMRQLVVRILRTLSISEIKSVTSATQALDLLSKGYQADLIIADYDMQPMDGVEFKRRLRRGAGEKIGRATCRERVGEKV